MQHVDTTLARSRDPVDDHVRPNQVCTSDAVNCTIVAADRNTSVKTLGQQYNERLFAEHFKDVCKIAKKQHRLMASACPVSGIDPLESLPLIHRVFVDNCHPFVVADHGVRYLRNAARVRTLEYIKTTNKRVDYLSDELLASLTHNYAIESDEDTTDTIAAMLSLEAPPPFDADPVPEQVVRQTAALANTIVEVRQYCCAMLKAVSQHLAKLVVKKIHASECAKLNPEDHATLAQTRLWTRHNLVARMEIVAKYLDNNAFDLDSSFYANFTLLGKAGVTLCTLLQRIENEHAAEICKGSGISDISDTTLRRIRDEFEDRRIQQRRSESTVMMNSTLLYEDYFRSILTAIYPLTKHNYPMVVKDQKKPRNKLVPCDASVN